MDRAPKTAEARYYCDSCMNRFTTSRGEEPPACPQCGHNRFVSKSLTGRTVLLLLVALLLVPLALGLWRRFSPPEVRPAVPALAAPNSVPEGKNPP